MIVTIGEPNSGQQFGSARLFPASLLASLLDCYLKLHLLFPLSLSLTLIQPYHTGNHLQQ